MMLNVNDIVSRVAEGGGGMATRTAGGNDKLDALLARGNERVDLGNGRPEVLGRVVVVRRVEDGKALWRENGVNMARFAPIFSRQIGCRGENVPDGPAEKRRRVTGRTSPTWRSETMAKENGGVLRRAWMLCGAAKTTAAAIVDSTRRSAVENCMVKLPRTRRVARVSGRRRRCKNPPAQAQRPGPLWDMRSCRRGNARALLTMRVVKKGAKSIAMLCGPGLVTQPKFRLGVIKRDAATVSLLIPFRPPPSSNKILNRNNNNVNNVNNNNVDNVNGQATLRPVPCKIFLGTHQATPQQEQLLDVISRERLNAMLTTFYERCFEDAVLKRFMFETDGARAHGERLGMWIAEKMSGEPEWSAVRPRDSRSRSHASAWYSEKRPQRLQGRRFKLDDCRMWMRMMFWACREHGLVGEHAGPNEDVFMTWYRTFIGHFIAVYERSAPPFVEDSVEWSASPSNIAHYVAAGFRMPDIEIDQALDE